MSGHFDTSDEVSYRHFGTGAEMSLVRSVLDPNCLYSHSTMSGTSGGE